MIYLQEGNFPLNEAFSSEIVQEANSTYQLTFKFPTSDPKWALLIPETELVADDLHGEQYFTIFEVEKQHGYVTVYANQVATLLNGYSINKINVDRVNGATVMNALVAGFKRETPFTFFSDVMSKHTLNLKDISAMEALAKDKHSIVGQWGGDLVRDKYSVRLLEHGGIENESLFAYKKNMKSFQETKSTKELRTRIHFKKVIEAHEEGKKDQILTVTIDSPLINKYKHIYEADMEVQDQDVVDQKTLEEYGKRYFRETLCDMIEESLEIDVVGQADQPVHMFDIASIFHEGYDVDLRKKITKYKFNPMSIKLVSIGFGEVTRTLADSISGMVNDSVDKKMKSYDAEYEAKVQKLVDNANAEYDKQAKELEHKITDGIEQAKARAEVLKEEISAQVTEKIAAASQANKNEIVEEFKAQYNGIEVKMQGLKATTDQLKTSDADIQKLINDFKAQTQSQFVGVQGAQSRFEQTTEKAISDLTNVTNGKADRSYVEQTVAGIKEEFTSLKIGGVNLLNGSKGPFKPNKQPANFDNNVLYKNETSIYLEQGQEYIVSAKTDGNFTALHIGGMESDNVVLWLMDDKYQNYQIVSDLKTGTFGTKIVWNKPTGIYHLRVNTYRKDPNKLKSVWEVKVEKATVRSEWSPSIKDQESLITEAKSSFERTANSLITRIASIESYVDSDEIRRDALNKYTREETAKQISAERSRIEENYVRKSSYNEDVASLNLKFEDLKQNNDQVIASKIAEYKQTVDGQFATVTNKLEDTIKKTDIQITPGQISLGVSKEISGKTISSLLVQEPESIALIAQLIKVKGDMVVDGSITSRHLASASVQTGHMEAGSVTTQILASNAVTADKLLVDYAMINKFVSNQAFIRELASQRAFITQLTSVGISANDIRGGRLTANSGVSSFDLDNGRLSFYDNFTGVFRDQSNASSQGLFFRNDDVTINGRRYINSKAIIGADRRDNDIRSHWNQGGFNGMIVDTIKGVGTGDHDNADKVTFVGDRFNFTHSYDYDPNTNTNPYGWKITTWGQTTISPFGTNGRNTNVQAGDFLLINNGNNGVWLRQALRTLKTALQHFVNAGFATDDFTPQNGRSMRIALHSSIRNAVASSLREFDKFGI
ncbi:phage tail spike protein [Streptococcus parasanguinis]|uniref:phage tail spike protein n=1 Tax=Streptococcus parasanguinis TaxID=1318 RepID=UPI000779AC96|nr:phage tail spike protein [Streptococcus parasanguinis]